MHPQSTKDILSILALTYLLRASTGGHLGLNGGLISFPFRSLSVTYLRNRLLNALRGSPDSKIREAVARVPPNIVFENPTLELLAARVANLVDEPGASQSLNPRQERIQAMNAMIMKYSVGLPGFDSTANGASHNGTYTDPAVVLLTGSTGGLGSFILSQLIENPAVERVYALNRPSSTSIEERQRSAFIDRDISVDLLDSKKLVYVETDASQDNCGFSPALYEEVAIPCRVVSTPLTCWDRSGTQLQ